jgi:hypothetical protein
LVDQPSYSCGVRREGSGSQVAAQQRVERGAQGGVCCPPVGFQVLCQVITCILQLILIQNDVKHFLREKGRGERAKERERQGERGEQRDILT